MRGRGGRPCFPAFPSRRWESQEGLGAQSGGSGSAWASGFRPGGTVIRKAPEDARQQRCGLGPGDLGRFWKGLGEGEGEEGEGGGERPRSRDEPFLICLGGLGSADAECKRQHLLVVMDTADNTHPCCGVCAPCAVWKAVCMRCVMWCYTLMGCVCLTGCIENRGCASNCVRVLVHTCIRQCVCGVVYTAGGVHHAVCASDSVCMGCGLNSRWCAPYGLLCTAGQGVCSKQPGPSVCSQSGAAGGQR